MSQCTDPRSEEQLCDTLTSTLYILYHIKVNLTTGNAKVSKKILRFFWNIMRFNKKKYRDKFTKIFCLEKIFSKFLYNRSQELLENNDRIFSNYCKNP